MKTLKKIKSACVLVIALTFLLSPAVSASEPIKIGAMFISSGKMGGYGKHGSQAIQLAVDEINADGGVLGRNLEAVIEDTKLKKDIALALAERFVNQDKVDFLMGPTSSGIAMGLTEFAREKKVATQLGVQRHVLEDVHRIVELVQSKAIGEISEVYAWYNSGRGMPADAITDPRSRTAEVTVPGNWTLQDLGEAGLGGAAYGRRVLFTLPVDEKTNRHIFIFYLRPDMAKYRAVSRQVFAVLDTLTPVVESASIDEAYLDLAAGRVDMLLADSVAMAEGFLNKPEGQDYQFIGPDLTAIA